MQHMPLFEQQQIWRFAMSAAKKLATIFLAIYLIVMGVVTIGCIVLPGVANQV
jgi:hypothetical protein